MEDYTSVEFSLFTYKNFSSPTCWEVILSTLLRGGASYAPERVDYGKNWKSLHYTEISSLAQEFSRVRSVHFRRDSQYKSEIGILVHEQKSPPYNIFNLWVEGSYFQEPENIGNFITTCKAIYEILEPFYGFIHQADDKVRMSTIEDPRYGKTVLPTNFSKGLPGAYWCNFLGHAYVEEIGIEKIMSAPSCTTEILSNGGIMIITSSSPLSFATVSSREAQKALKNHLGVEFFYR